ncbi:hypothetical protein Dtox_3949 [Desulfofarcimen acetoxidans DSM 771]|uniref:PD-(D/E)XK endonuclease-like domain-containing protein n=1 Tax=Desulfofarcimen acetoxidans (strain ATCC 49208 / DSM 771 / KCTC 5769 / VKM B-1644 / 5575) TaxID=485916 RepID=C8VY13_DESAS|nr:PD-(D/E)XK nuclease family protein [Desulfofarcimen acetoxidans]ACV64642.1 hypothetical protein Dtox_3949 [Desulfofarcimen acetoxidans DSM 771]
MLSARLKNLYFSQQSLNIYNTCALKFRLRHIDGLYWPQSRTTEEEKHSIEKGRQFHLLAQRYYSCLDNTVPRGSPYEHDLRQWLDSLRNTFAMTGENSYYPEFTLRLNRNGIKLQAQYDLIVLTPDNSLIIYDWKTDARPLRKTELLNRMQTMLYLFLLAETASVITAGQAVEPEKIKMIYWNPIFAGQNIEIDYSAARHKDFARYITGLIKRILQLNYPDFQATEEKNHCGRCEYSPICRGEKSRAEIEFDSIEDAVEEINEDYLSFENF